MAYKNKIVFDGETLIDLTEDTITPDDLRVGVTAHDMSGAPIVGTMVGSTTGGTVITDLPYQDGELYFTGDEQTPTWANYDPEIMEIWGEKSAISSGDYEVTFYLADGYVWPDGSNAYKVTWTIILVANPIFGENTPVEIKETVSSGLAPSLWALGDMIAITLNGAVGSRTFSDATYYAFILGFDHNTDLETSGKHSLTLEVGKTANGTDIAFCRSSSSGYVMSSSGSTAGGWASCIFKTTYCPAFFEAMPDEWQNVISTITKYTHNAEGGGSNQNASNITPTDEQIFLLAEYEVFKARTWASNYESNYQQQYDYYAAGNSKVKYNDLATSTTVSWWERSPCCNGGGTSYWCRYNPSSNDAGYAGVTSDCAFAPAFVIT